MGALLYSINLRNLELFLATVLWLHFSRQIQHISSSLSTFERAGVFISLLVLVCSFVLHLPAKCCSLLQALIDI